MGFDPISIAIVGAVIAGAGTVASISQSRKARRAQQEQADVQRATNQISGRESRRRAAREARIKRAVVAQQAEAQGIGGSSAELGAESALAAGVSNQSAQQAFQTRAAEGLAQTQQKIADANARIQTTSAIGNLGSSLFSAAGGGKTLFAAANS